MKVLSIPYTSNNPYQDNLAASLEKLGVTTVTDIRFNARRLSVIRKIFRRKDIQIVHYHWLDPFIRGKNTPGLIANNIIFLLEVAVIRLLGKRIIWTVHNLVPHDVSHEKILVFSTRIFTKFTDAIIAHTDRSGKLVMKNLKVDKSKIRVIPHGNYINNYENSITGDQARIKLGLGENVFVLLFIGRLRPYKGLERLIDSMGQMANRNIHLLVTGFTADGRYAESMQEKVSGKPNITLHVGFIPKEEIQYYLNAADIVVLPYTDILTSGSVCLAMSFGKPVIAPDTGELTEIINDKGGILYEPADTGALINAIKQAEEADLQAMGAYNLARAKSIDWDTIAEATRSVYQSCLHSTN